MNIYIYTHTDMYVDMNMNTWSITLFYITVDTCATFCCPSWIGVRDKLQYRTPLYITQKQKHKI